MLRAVPVAAFAVFVSSAPLFAQNTTITVTATSEVTIATAPQLAVGADVVYRSRRSANDDTFEVGGFGIGLSAHWYFRLENISGARGPIHCQRAYSV